MRYSKSIYSILPAIMIFVGQAYAQDTLLIDKTNESIVSGTVTKVQGKSVFIESSGKNIEIDLDELEIDNPDSFFQPGMRVTAKGEFEDDGYTPSFDATEIIRSEGEPATEAIILNSDNDNID